MLGNFFIFPVVVACCSCLFAVAVLSLCLNAYARSFPPIRSSREEALLRWGVEEEEITADAEREKERGID